MSTIRAVRKRVFACHESLAAILHTTIESDNFPHPIPPLVAAIQLMLTPRKAILSFMPEAFVFTPHWTVVFLYKKPDRTVRIVDPLSGVTLRQLKDTRHPVSLCVVESYLVVGDLDLNCLLIYDTDTAVLLAKIWSRAQGSSSYLAAPTAVAELSGGCCIVTETAAMELRIFQIVEAAENGDHIRNLKPPSRHIKTISVKTMPFTVLRSTSPNAKPTDDVLLLWNDKEVKEMPLNSTSRAPPKTRCTLDSRIDALIALAPQTKTDLLQSAIEVTIRPVLVISGYELALLDPDTGRTCPLLTQKSCPYWFHQRSAVATTCDGRAIGMHALNTESYRQSEFTMMHIDPSVLFPLKM